MSQPNKTGNNLILHEALADQGLMQDKIIASYTCFGGQVDVNC